MSKIAKSFDTLLVKKYRQSLLGINSMQLEPVPLLDDSVKRESKDILQTVIRLYENNDSINVIDVRDITKWTNMNSGSTSMVKNFGIEGIHNGNMGFKASVIVKMLTKKILDESYRSTLAGVNEMHAYTKILPILQKYYSDSLMLPGCLGINKHFSVFVDACGVGYSIANRNNCGLTVPQVEKTIVALARLHAASYICKLNAPETFDHITSISKTLPTNSSESLFSDNQVKFLNDLETFYISAGDKKYGLKESKNIKDGVKLIKYLQKNAKNKVMELLDKEHEHAVLCHGEPSFNNLMFDKDNNAILLDYQTMRYCSPASDLSYLLHVNMEPAERVLETPRLLNKYLNHLRKFIKKQNVNMDNVLTMDWLAEEYEKFHILGNMYALLMVPMLYSDEIPQDELYDLDLSRDSRMYQRIREIIYYYTNTLKIDLMNEYSEELNLD